VSTLQGLWRQAGLPVEALGFAELTGAEPVLPSSFAVATAAQAAIAAAALAACEVGHVRNAPRQQVSVDIRLSRTPVAWTCPVMPPGSSLPQW
jgi:hypothetical protein